MDVTAPVKLTSVAISKLSPSVGDELSVTLNSGAEASAYQWYRGTEKIDGATDLKYTVTKDDVGYALYVEATDKYDETNVQKSEKTDKIEIATITAKWKEEYKEITEALKSVLIEKANGRIHIPSARP